MSGASALSPAMAAEILARLDRLDTQLRQVQATVPLDHLERQLTQVKQLVRAGVADQPLSPAQAALLTAPPGRSPAETMPQREEQRRRSRRSSLMAARSSRLWRLRRSKYSSRWSASDRAGRAGGWLYHRPAVSIAG
jgi:hypothetical protein